MRSNLLRAVCLPLATILLLGPVAPVAASPSPPVVSVFLDPASADGQSGWWRTPPQVFASVDQDSVLHYDWGSGDTTLAATSGALESVGFAPEGESTVTISAVNAVEETSALAVRRMKTDSIPPSQPANLVASSAGGVVSLSWDPASDDTSGVRWYTVFRNFTGPPFTSGDVIAFVDGSTSFAETDPMGGGVWFYGVRAVDGAGNPSLMSDAVRASADVTPPTAPSDLQAWLNGRGFVRVSWQPSYDKGSGVAAYEIERAFPGQVFSSVATVQAGALYWDDEDLDAVAEDCTYRVTALDRAGNRSPVAGPVDRGTDLVAPGVPDEPVALGALPDDGHPLHTIPVAFTVGWVEPRDEGSGVARYEVAYGPDAALPSWVRYTDRVSLRIESAVEWADWSFTVRAEDRAGNLSDPTEPVRQRVARTEQFGGSDRVSTAITASSRTFASSRAVVVASAWSFPDGLSASSLAGALDAPILLVGPGSVRTDVQAELSRLGAEDVYVVGGPPAVSAETLGSLDALVSGEVTRVAGLDRYATAAAVAARVRTITGGTPSHVILVSGETFPDALSAGPLAFVTRWPILFARRSALPAVTQAAIGSSGATETLIVGSQRAVWGDVDRRVPKPYRLAGEDRYMTSMLLAEWAVGRGLLTAARPVFVDGTTFPDGLSAAPLAAKREAPVLLVPQTGAMPVGPAHFMLAHAADVRSTAVLGMRVESDVLVRLWRYVQLLPSYAY